MGCLACQEKISDYIDGLLPTPERRQVEAHLSTCRLCHTIYRDLVMICEASRNLPDYEPSEVVWQRILAEIAPSGAGASIASGTRWPVRRLLPFKPRSLWGYPMWAVAALLLIAMATVVFFRSPSRPVERTALNGMHWTDGRHLLTVRRTNRIIVHKSHIQVDLVKQRIAELQKRIEAAQVRWSPEVRALYQRHLSMIDHCLHNCQDQLTRQSRDPAVRDVFEATLRAKLELLKQFAEM